MFKKKHSFSLIEILLAFALASILFGCIFSNFFQTYKLKEKLEKAHAISLNREHIQLRLHELFSELPFDPESSDTQLGATEDQNPLDTPSPKEHWSNFYTDNFRGSKALFFFLTKDYAKDQRFIGPLIFCLYHDEKNQALHLLTSNADEMEKTEELMHGVSQWEMSFFDTDIGQWVTHWPKTKETFPSLLKLKIFENHKNKKTSFEEFSFVLQEARQPLVYGL